MSRVREIYFGNSASTTGQRILFGGVKLIGIGGEGGTLPDTSYLNNIAMEIAFMLTNCGTVAVAPNTSEPFGTQSFILCSFGDPSAGLERDTFILIAAHNGSSYILRVLYKLKDITGVFDVTGSQIYLNKRYYVFMSCIANNFSFYIKEINPSVDMSTIPYLIYYKTLPYKFAFTHVGGLGCVNDSDPAKKIAFRYYLDSSLRSLVAQGIHVSMFRYYKLNTYYAYATVKYNDNQYGSNLRLSGDTLPLMMLDTVTVNKGYIDAYNNVKSGYSTSISTGNIAYYVQPMWISTNIPYKKSYMSMGSPPSIQSSVLQWIQNFPIAPTYTIAYGYTGYLYLEIYGTKSTEGSSTLYNSGDPQTYPGVASTSSPNLSTLSADLPYFGVNSLSVVAKTF